MKPDGYIWFIKSLPTAKMPDFSEEYEMYILHGYEMHAILLNGPDTITSFSKHVDMAINNLYKHFDKVRVKTWMRNKVMEFVGEENYWRELIRIRTERKMRTAVMREHYAMITKSKARKKQSQPTE